MALLFTPSAFRRVLIAAGFLLVFFPLLFSFLVNRWFAQHESSILAYLNESLRVPLHAERLYYSLLRGVVIENFSLEEGVDPALASPIRVARIQIHPSVSFFPHPGFQLGRVIFEEPTFSVRAALPDLMKMGRFLSASPKKDRRFGPFYLNMRLSSLRIVRGKVTFLSPSERPWRQEFEGIRFFLGRRLWGGERFEFEGHVVGNRKASFRIRANLRNPLPDAAHVDLIIDCRQFATAYLKPYLGNTLELPDEEVNALIRLKVRKGKAFVSKGRISFQKAEERDEFLPKLVSWISSSLAYEVQGEIEKERCRLKKLVLRTAGVSLKGDGDIIFSNKASIYRVSLVSKKTPARNFRKILPDLDITSGYVQLLFTFTGSSQRFSPSLDLMMEDCSFYDKKRALSWSKVDGRFRLSRDRIVMDEVWAFLNDFPVRLRGMLYGADHPHLQLEMSTYPGQFSILRPKNPLNAATRFIGDYDGKRWMGDLWITNYLYRGPRQEEEKWKVAFHGIAVEGLLPDQFLHDLFEGRKIESQCVVLRHTGPERLFHLAMRHASFFLSAEPGMIRCDLLEGPFNRGSLYFQSWIDVRRFPRFSWTLNGSLAEADLTVLLDRFEKRYPVTGRLTGEGTWNQEGRTSQFLGRFRLAEGTVGPTVPLQKLADETGIEPLRQIQFREFSGHVSFRSGDLDLDNLKILSDQAELLANVKVREERLTGTLSAKFPASSVRKSSQLKGLLRYVGENEKVDFDFKIAGSLGVPRIQWLSGEFKRKVEAKLAPWMQKQLAKEMEKILGEKKEPGRSN